MEQQHVDALARKIIMASNQNLVEVCPVTSQPEGPSINVPNGPPSPARSFSWTFPINVDSLSSADAQFGPLLTALDSASTDTREARNQIDVQTAELVFYANDHLNKTEKVLDDLHDQVAKLRQALRNAHDGMARVRDEYVAIAKDATTFGMSVTTSGTSTTVTLRANATQFSIDQFNALHDRERYNTSCYDAGEWELSDALDAIDASWWDATLGGVLDQLVGIVVPPLGDRHAVLKTIEWGQGLRSTAADTTRAAFLFRHHASYRKPPKFNSLSRWEKLTAPGDLANWKPAGMRPGGGGAPKPPGVLRNLEKGGKIAGGAMAVLDGALTAYDSYQSDSYNHPEMGEGEKITRAGVKGVTTGALGWAGATYGAQLGATIGAFGGPLGVLAGGIIGGVVGGMAGSWAGSTFSDIANAGISHLFHWGASS